MKRIIYLYIIIAGLVFASCEGFLDRQPKSSLSQETYWQTEQDLKTWNSGMYNGLQAVLKNNWFYWGELRSGVYRARGTAWDSNLLYNGLTSGSGSSNWNNVYSTIYRANAAIKHIPEMPLGSTTTNVYLGQAYAMRALMYFYAIRVWGDVPMITEPLEDVSSQERYYGRTSIMELKPFILKDLENAMTAFGPSTSTGSSSKYTLNRGSAMAIKLDVLMWYKEYDQALTVANDLITNYGYELQKSNTYKSMFLDPATSKEMIFNLYWSYEEDEGGFGYAQEIASGSNTIRYHPTEAVYKELIARKDEDMRTSMVMDTFSIKRFISPDAMDEYSYAKAHNGDYGNAANFQINCPKFNEYGPTAYTDDKGNKSPGYIYDANGECSTHMPIYRLADILLLKAEALVLGTNKDFQGAIDIVNDIRERAGWTKEATLADYPTAHEVLKLIIDERMVEFWGEGKHWFDLVRNDLVKEYLDGYMNNANDEDYENELGFDIGVEKPSADHIGGYGRILWPLNQDVFRKNPSMRGHQNPPYEE